jgi:ABC-type dipeptide/oligopeptide/nickel transport system permease component
MIQIMQSTVERLLYILLALVFLAVLVVGAIAYNDGQQVKQITEQHSSEIKNIETNQHINALAIKQYIACLLNLSPTQTQAQIKTAELTCFDNAPEVK